VNTIIIKLHEGYALSKCFSLFAAVSDIHSSHD